MRLFLNCCFLLNVSFGCYSAGIEEAFQRLREACKKNNFCKAHDFHTIQLEEAKEVIELKKMKMEKVYLDGFYKGQHYVYRGTDFYIKFWGQDDPRCLIFYDAFQLGFYENIAPIVALIFSEENCLGYVTKKCEPLIARKDYIPSARRRDVIKLSARQPPSLEELISLCIERQLETGYTYADFKATNLGKIKKKTYIIDLDSVVLPGFSGKKIDPEVVVKNTYNGRENSDRFHR